MLNSISLSQQHLTLGDVARFQAALESSLRFYYANPVLSVFAGYSEQELAAELNGKLVELQHSSSLAVFAAIEAAFMLDAYQRVRRRRKDPLSRALRKMDKRKSRLNLEQDIIGVWRNHGAIPLHKLGEFAGALNYRHWLAHGRYWAGRFGQNYDYESVFALADEIIEHLAAG